jgi:hypothetical protein
MQQHSRGDSGDMLVVDDRSQLSPVCQRLIAQSDALIAQSKQARAECAALVAQLNAQAHAAMEHAKHTYRLIPHPWLE